FTTPWEIAIERGGGTALVNDCGPGGCTTGAGRIARVDLGTGQVTTLYGLGFGMGRFAIEPAGTLIGALSMPPAPYGLVRIDPATGAITYLSNNLFTGLTALWLEPGGATAIGLESRTLCGTVYRVVVP